MWRTLYIAYTVIDMDIYPFMLEHMWSLIVCYPLWLGRLPSYDHVPSIYLCNASPCLLGYLVPVSEESNIQLPSVHGVHKWHNISINW